MHILFVILAVVALGAWWRYNQRSLAAVWVQAADELGLTYHPGGLIRARVLEGDLYEQHVRVETLFDNSGDSWTRRTVYHIYYTETLALGLRLTRPGSLSRISTQLGAQDIEVDDIRFDDGIVVKGIDARRVKDFLTPARRVRILRLFETFDELLVHDHGIISSTGGVCGQADEIVFTVRALAFAAVRLTDGSDRAPIVEPDFEAHHDRPSDEARDQTHPATERVTSPETVLQAAASKTDEPPLPAIAHERTIEAPPLAEVEQEDGLDVAAVCEQLFATKVTSLEAAKHFDRTMKNRRVRWSGVLRQVSPFSIDLVFGNDSGTKATLELLEAGGGTSGRKVQAIVQLPPEDLDALSQRLGETIGFAGRLVKCNPIMRGLYIADGSLDGRSRETEQAV